MNIGEVIVELRKRKGLKQKELAKELKISASYLSLVENNEQKPSVALIASIANYFDLPVTAIFFKALDADKVTSTEQKRYFKAAKPVVEALIDFLLSGEKSPRGKDLLVHTSRGNRLTA